MAESVTPSESGTAEKVESLRKAVRDYTGYEQPEDRSVSDESLRAFLAASLGELLSHVQSLQEYLESVQEANLLRVLDDVESRTEFLHDAMHLASYAVSPFFTARRLPDAVLDSVVQSDIQLLYLTRRISGLLEPTLDKDSDFASLVVSLREIVHEFGLATEERVATITEFLA